MLLCVPSLRVLLVPFFFHIQLVMIQAKAVSASRHTLYARGNTVTRPLCTRVHGHAQPQQNRAGLVPMAVDFRRQSWTKPDVDVRRLQPSEFCSIWVLGSLGLCKSVWMPDNNIT